MRCRSSLESNWNRRRVSRTCWWWIGWSIRRRIKSRGRPTRAPMRALWSELPACHGGLPSASARVWICKHVGLIFVRGEVQALEVLFDGDVQSFSAGVDCGVDANRIRSGPLRDVLPGNFYSHEPLIELSVHGSGFTGLQGVGQRCSAGEFDEFGAFALALQRGDLGLGEAQTDGIETNSELHAVRRAGELYTL